MSVYVDDRLAAAAVRNGDHVVRGRWSAMFADARPELLAFGERLGLPADWLRHPRSPMERFEVTAGKRLRALDLGAVPITAQEGLRLVRAKRAGAPFDLRLLRADPRAFDALLAVPARAAPPGAPVRVRLSRGQGPPPPPNTVSVARPSRWANPYRPASASTPAAAAAVEHFTAYLRRNPALLAQAVPELRGRNLACWCSPRLPCHADVWLALVNADDPPAALAGPPGPEEARHG